MAGRAYHRLILILLRHARTPANAEGLFQGRADPSLDDFGRGQAALVGRALLRRWAVDRVVCSPRRRALETVSAAGLDRAGVAVDERWREIDFGCYEGRPMESQSGLMSAWAADAAYTPPGGESLAALHRRVGEALAELEEPARSANVVVVSHATPVKSAAAHLLGGDAAMIMRARVGLASVIAFEPSAAGLVLTEFNWTGPPEAGRTAGERARAEPPPPGRG